MIEGAIVCKQCSFGKISDQRRSRFVGVTAFQRFGQMLLHAGVD